MVMRVKNVSHRSLMIFSFGRHSIATSVVIVADMRSNPMKTKRLLKNMVKNQEASDTTETFF